MTNAILKTFWLLLLVLSLGASLLFVQGIRRDTHAGEPELAVDLSRRSDWVRQSFKVGKPSHYKLYLTSVNHAPPFGARFAGAIEARITDPHGARVFDHRFEPGSTDHLRPDNMHWTTLTQVTLAGAKRGWQLEARVVEPDSAFTGVISRVLLREDRADPGMGGMVNYVMPIPAIAFALISLFVGLLIAHRGGGKLAFRLSIAVLIVWFIVVIGHFTF